MVPLFSRRRGTPLHYSLKLIRANDNRCTVMRCTSKMNCSKQFFRHVIILAPIVSLRPPPPEAASPLLALLRFTVCSLPALLHEGKDSPCRSQSGHARPMDANKVHDLGRSATPAMERLLTYQLPRNLRS